MIFQISEESKKVKNVARNKRGNIYLMIKILNKKIIIYFEFLKNILKSSEG